MKIEEKLTSNKFKRLCETDSIIIHPNEIVRDYVEDNGLWFFRTQNIRPLKIEESNNVFISKDDADKLVKNKIKKNDILITRTGANYGQTAIYNIDKTAIASSHTFILRNNYFNQFYLAVFFNTIHGRKLIDKGMYGGAQPEIAPYYLSNIPIPDLSIKFQTLIESILKESEKIILNSSNLYAEAEKILLKALSSKQFSYSKESVNIKSFKESLSQTGRLDAEYYQRKYDDLEEYILKTGQGIRLGSDLILNKRGKQPIYIDSSEGIPVLNSKHIRENKISFSDNRTGSLEEINAELVIRKNDVLINGTGVGTIGRSAVYMRNEPALPDNHVTILRTKDIDPVFLSVQLNSVIGKLQVEKYFKGSSGQIELYPSDIDEFIIWKAPPEIQRQIRETIEESEKLRLKSESLLKIAKNAVEIAIEDGEDKAMAYINLNT